jgi:hypothetical protein
VLQEHPVDGAVPARPQHSPAPVSPSSTPSAYYPEDDPNYVEYDDRGGSHERNPNQLDVQNYEMEVPLDPTPKGITIDASLVDNTMGTSNEEYGGGPQGIALNGAIAFAAMAAPGDDLADEQYTFDLYEGHPAGTTYHYHFKSIVPMKALYGFHRELTSCLLCAMVGVGAGRQPFRTSPRRDKALSQRPEACDNTLCGTPSDPSDVEP